jgi:hypothetical protein
VGPAARLRGVLQHLQWETLNARWIVAVLETPTGFRCDYRGASSRLTAVKPPDDAAAAAASEMGRGSFVGNNVDQLLAQARRAIENIDGPIER